MDMVDQGAAEGTGRDTAARKWRPALAFAVPTCLLILGAFTYWFAVADRFFIFLYYHDMGPVVPDSTPFSPVTSSRYWMAGLVAGGFVLVLYAVANWLLGRLRTGYRPPVWWRVWSLCLLPLLVAIPALTMTANAPALPLANTAQVTLATLIGLAFALLPGKTAAEHPGDLAWLAADGWGLMLMLVALGGLDHLPHWLASGRTVWVVTLFVTTLAGLAWLLFVTVLRAWRRTAVPGTGALFIAGLTMAYLFMPVVHYLLGTDGYFYITNSNNFFSDGVLLQLSIWLLVAGVAAGVTLLRGRLAAWRAEPRGAVV